MSPTSYRAAPPRDGTIYEALMNGDKLNYTIAPKLKSRSLLAELFAMYFFGDLPKYVVSLETSYSGIKGDM